jgi:8-oxo-dGTP diphosphatase
MGLIHVAAGAVRDRDGRVLVTRRPEHVHQGGLWELPGGKLEPGEGVHEGLVRELEEELGIRVRASRPLIRVHHDYGDRRVLLDARCVLAYEGTPHGREAQPLKWLHPSAMLPAQFPAADRPIIAALRLPRRYLVTGPEPADPEAFLGRLARALQSGLRLVQLRAHALGEDDYAALAERAFRVCERHGAALILNRGFESASRLPCRGLHLTGRRLAALSARPPGHWQWVGASCHDARELARAAQLGLDYALLSPVLPTASHPEARPLGWGCFAALVDQAALPVYALGGLGPGHLETAIRHGAQGVAAIRGLWPD